MSVCVYLLAAARAGRLPFVDLLPEGYEDADCRCTDGSRRFVQMKELDAGHGELSAAKIAEALAHAEASARGEEIVVITDGGLASQIAFTGWDATIGQQVGPGRDRILAGLRRHGLSAEEADEVLSRSRLIQLPYRIRQESEALLAEALPLHPAIAGIGVDRLTEEVAKAAAAQRRTTVSTAKRVRVSDIDALIAAAQEAVDVTGLDVAVADGVCSPVSFLPADDLRAKTFYLGIDGQPAHVAADFDVVRTDELRACDEGLHDEQSVMLIGPSGSGKSVLLWRAARDLVPAARVVRVERLVDARDTALLARHVRLLRPTRTSPILVVADNLGRPEMAAWPSAASALRELPEVLLLGAARSEDFTPTLLVGATRVVEPWLRMEVAQLLSERMTRQGITTKMTPEEAFERSEGLLMEFVALLSTGQRLRQVLGAQVEALKDPKRHVQREAARLVTTAHTLGLSLHADRLAAALAAPRGAGAVAPVGDALGVLRDEHIVVREGDRWRGLHELRSTTLVELLHQNPPPRLGDTLSRLAAVIDPVHAGWMIRRVAERFPTSVPDVADALRDEFAGHMTARDLASLLEGAERADNALYVHEVLPMLESRRPDGMTLANLAFLAYPQRNQGMDWGIIEHDALGAGLRRVVAIAGELPLRSDFEQTVARVGDHLTSQQLTTILDGADLVDALRVLEAGGHRLTVPLEAVTALARRMDDPTDLSSALLWSRLVAGCAPHLTTAQLADIWGTPAERTETLCRADELALTVAVEDTKVHVVRLLAPDGSGEMPPLLPWDVHRPGADNALNESAVACLERIKDACPELHQFEVTTVTADGRPYRIADHEPGHKDMPRKSFKPRESVRQAVGFQAALRRATSSQTWTEIVTIQIEIAAALTAVANELPLRLKAEDNARRRATWRSELTDISHKLSALSPPPLLDGAGPDSAMSLSDYADRQVDGATQVLTAAADAVNRACSDDDNVRPIVAAMGLRDAAAELATARSRASASVHGQGEVLPEELSASLHIAANLAAALQVEPAMSRRISAADPRGTSIQIWEKVRERQALESAEILANALRESPEATFAMVNDPAPESWWLDHRSWAVFAPVELLDDIVAALEVLDDDERDKLGRVAVLAVVPDDVLEADAEAPSGTGREAGAPHVSDAPQGAPETQADNKPPMFLGPQRCLSLGLGIQLASSTGRSALPMTAKRVDELARNANLLQPQTGEGVAATLESLVARSSEAARRRLRQLADPSTGRDPASLENKAVDEDAVEDRAVEDRAVAFSADSASALAVLEQHVDDEEAGRTDLHLAEVVTRSVRGVPLDEAASALLAAVAHLHITSLQPLGGVDNG